MRLAKIFYHGRHGRHGKGRKVPSRLSEHSVSSGKRQASLVVLINCNVLIMVTDRKPCSRLQSGRERSCPPTLGKANARAVASRELGSASLHKIGSGQSAGSDEASIGGVASITRTCRTPRGERRQRARTESPGTWEARSGVQWGPLSAGSHNRRRGRIAASDGLIVASISRSSREGAKEPWPVSRGVRGAGS
jgi:hypothetical protein